MAPLTSSFGVLSTTGTGKTKKAQTRRVTPWCRYSAKIVLENVPVRRVWNSEPSHSRTVLDEKCYLYRATSINSASINHHVMYVPSRVQNESAFCRWTKPVHKTKSVWSLIFFHPYLKEKHNIIKKRAIMLDV